MEKSILDDYFKKIEFKGRVCDSPEEIAAMKEMNQKMREVVQEYNHKHALSVCAARRMILDRSH